MHSMQHESGSRLTQVMSICFTFQVLASFLVCFCLLFCGATGLRKTFRSDGKVFRVTENPTDNHESACITKMVVFLICFVVFYTNQHVHCDEKTGTEFVILQVVVTKMMRMVIPTRL